jgi:peptidyl-prolyl cis-trans isomerase C
MPESHPSASNPYLALKLAQKLFQKTPCMLASDERQRVDHVVVRQLKIEQRILATPEAAQVFLPPSSLDQAIAEIRGRYESEDEYLADLEKSGLDPVLLASAVERDLKFEAVLDRVASRAADVTETDVEIFYLIHRERFCRPENRTLRHILVTIDENMFGNERLMAYRRIDEIRIRLLKSPERFSEQALKHSECPTAMNGGLLGTLKRGELYPELEPVAFALGPGDLSAIVESPMGFHLIQCVSVEAPGEMSLASVREKIRTHLVESRRHAAQKTWIAGLFSKERQEA